MKKRKATHSTIAAFLLTVGSAASSTAWAVPAQVIIIRHAEKQDLGNELSPRGWARARALEKFFRLNRAASRFGPPVAIYAASPMTPESSIRPLQTVTPFAASLGLRIRHRYRRDDLQALVHEVMNKSEYSGKTVVICWVRRTIATLPGAFGARRSPEQWPSHSFDRAWFLDFSIGPPVRFHDVPQRLLSGDSSD